MADVGYVQEGPTSNMYDNQGYIACVENLTHHYHTKHIDE